MKRLPYAIKNKGEKDHESEEDDEAFVRISVEKVDSSPAKSNDLECSPVNLMTKYGSVAIRPKLAECNTVIEESV